MTPADPIEFFNRYTGRVETEDVYGEAFLRWAYDSRMGRMALPAFARRAAFSHLYGWLMSTARSVDRIRPFVEKYGLDPADFALNPEAFRSFNEFFSRALRQGKRPVSPDPDVVVFPADGRHLGFENASRIERVFVKGQKFDLPALLGDAALARDYAEGTLVLSRLCPVDYHRFHFPLCGVPEPPELLPGALYSVSPIALRRRLAYLWENKRTLTRLRSGRFGTVLQLEIGATNVGSIRQTFRPGLPVAKGQEKGLFLFGGSSTITIFPPGRVRLSADLLEQTAEGRELYAWMGDAMGVRLPP